MILKRRLAAGDISLDEYEQLLVAISRPDPGRVTSTTGQENVEMTAAVLHPMPVRCGGRWRVVAIGAVLVAIVLAVLGSSRGVSAHAKLVRAEPAPGSTVTATPATIRAWFSNELDVGRSAITVWDGRGRRVDDGKSGVDLNDLDRESLVAALKAVGPGTYRVKWLAVSADDLNVADGEFWFTVAPAR